MDEMVSMMMELTAEVWVLKKRFYLLERAAREKGLDLTAAIEQAELSAAENERLEAERKAMVASLLRAIEAEFGQPDDGAADQDPEPAATRLVDGKTGESRAA
jgi:hypothetical protein